MSGVSRPSVVREGGNTHLEQPQDAMFVVAAPRRRHRAGPRPSGLQRRLCAARPPAPAWLVAKAQAGRLGCGGRGRCSWYRRTLRRYTNIARRLEHIRGRRAVLLQRRAARLSSAKRLQSGSRQTGDVHQPKEADDRLEIIDPEVTCEAALTEVSVSIVGAEMPSENIEARILRPAQTGKRKAETPEGEPPVKVQKTGGWGCSIM